MAGRKKNRAALHQKAMGTRFRAKSIGGTITKLLKVF